MKDWAYSCIPVLYKFLKDELENGTDSIAINLMPDTSSRC
jgi:hypothetical protein